MNVQADVTPLVVRHLSIFMFVFFDSLHIAITTRRPIAQGSNALGRITIPSLGIPRAIEEGVLTVFFLIPALWFTISQRLHSSLAGLESAYDCEADQRRGCV